MISLKYLVGLILSGLLLVSCNPYPPGFRPDMPPTDPALVPNQPHQKTIAQLERELSERKAEEKRRVAARKRAADAAAREHLAQENPQVTNPTGTNPTGTNPTGTNPTGTTNTPRTDQPIKRQPAYNTAQVIPGKTGYVFNPWTNNAVDVRGIPSGSLVWDPNDPNKATHKFRVP